MATLAALLAVWRLGLEHESGPSGLRGIGTMQTCCKTRSIILSPRWKDCFSLNQGWAATAQWHVTESRRSAPIMSTTDAEKAMCVWCVCACLCIWDCYLNWLLFLLRKLIGQMFNQICILEHTTAMHTAKIIFCGSWCLKLWGGGTMYISNL